MKIKMTLLVVITAIATLSFTYVATQNAKSTNTATAEASHGEAIGGLVSEEN
jgi:hypothetical protein